MGVRGFLALFSNTKPRTANKLERFLSVHIYSQSRGEKTWQSFLIRGLEALSERKGRDPVINVATGSNRLVKQVQLAKKNVKPKME